jgi:galactose mutarotase-like enzyme
MLRSVLCLVLSILAEVSAQSPFQKYSIAAPGISASFIPYGARLTDLVVNDKDGNPQDVVLGYDDGAQYLTDTETVHTYFGPIVGYVLGSESTIPARLD